MRSAAALTCVLLIASATTSTHARASSAADVLTVADVEKVSGLTGLKTTPKNQATGAAGDLNFAGADGKLVAIVMISTSMWDFWNKQYGSKGEPVTGIGTGGFRTKAGRFPSYIVFKKGSTAVWIQSMGFKKGGGENLSPAQLTELATIAAGRM